MRVCAKPGCPTLIGKADSYCRAHRPRDTSPTLIARNKRSERRRRAETVASWVRLNGWVCPGYQCDPHPATDLTADHVVAVANGGRDGALRVLCRSCNGRKGDR